MGRDLLRQILLVLALVVIVCCLAAWPAWAWGGEAGLQALGVAGVICLLAAAAARLVTALLKGLSSDASAAPQAIQAGIGVRMMLTLAASLPVFLTDWLPQKQFVVWLGLHYLTQLALEVFVSMRELGQNHGPIEEQPGGTGTGERAQANSTTVHSDGAQAEDSDTTHGNAAKNGQSGAKPE